VPRVKRATDRIKKSFFIVVCLIIDLIRLSFS